MLLRPTPAVPIPTMGRSQHHHAVLFVGVGLLAAVAACAAADSCDTMDLAGQLDSFCRPDEASYHHHYPACCEAVRSAVEISRTADPLCICRLEEEPAFIDSALSIRELPDIYTACGGPNSRDVQLVAHRCFDLAPPPQQQHGPVHVEAIYADQPTPE